MRGSSLANAAVPVGDRVGGRDPGHHRRRAVVGLSRTPTERAFDRRLNLYLRTLIAEVATPDEPPDRQFQSLGEPLFELPLSGWYWQIDADRYEKPRRARRARCGTRSCRSSRRPASS